MDNKTGISHKRDDVAESTPRTRGHVIGSRRFPDMHVDDKGNVLIPKNEANGAMLAAQSWEVQRNAILRELDRELFRIKIARLLNWPGLLRCKILFFLRKSTLSILYCCERVLSKGNDPRMVVHVETPNE